MIPIIIDFSGAPERSVVNTYAPLVHGPIVLPWEYARCVWFVTTIGFAAYIIVNLVIYNHNFKYNEKI